MLKGLPRTKSGIKIRDLLIEYAAKISAPIDIKVEGKRMNLLR